MLIRVSVAHPFSLLSSIPLLSMWHNLFIFMVRRLDFSGVLLLRATLAFSFMSPGLRAGNMIH